MTATVAHIWRHPLKSHGREELGRVTLTAGQGLPWDRRWAVAHDAARIQDGEWAPCVNFSRGSKAPNLMAINARLNEATAELTLSHPERPDLTFRPDLAADQARFIEWVKPISPADRALPERIYSIPVRGMTDTDYPSVSLFGLASNRALSQQMGADLSPRRWRGNFWIEGLEPYAEFDLIGQKIRLGTALLEVVEPIERCLATTTNPDTGIRDADTLAALTEAFGHRNFGVYARVLQSGIVSRHDRLEIAP